MNSKASYIILKYGANRAYTLWMQYTWNHVHRDKLTTAEYAELDEFFTTISEDELDEFLRIHAPVR